MPDARAIEQDLRRRVSGDVLFDDISRILFSTDASIYQTRPLGVVIPKTIDDVVSVVRYCSSNHIPITSRGAGTSLAGQSIGSGILLVFNKYFCDILGTNQEEKTVRVQPGVVLDNLNRTLRSSTVDSGIPSFQKSITPSVHHFSQPGLMFGPDPSTGKQCVIGGMIGTNAAGPHTIKYGATKDNIIELTVVTADGELRRISNSKSNKDDFTRTVSQVLLPHRQLINEKSPKTSKNSSGYNLKDALADGSVDLTKLFCGSEGTLGVVVEAKLKLIPVSRAKRNLVAYFRSYESCANAAKESLQFGPAAVEMLDKTFSNAALGIDPAIDEVLEKNFVAILIFEFEEDDGKIADEKVAKLSNYLKAQSLSTDQLLPRDGAEVARLWRVRKEASAIFYKIEKPGKKTSFVEDVAVPVENLPAYLDAAQDVFKRHDLKYALYGHAGNGNIHTILLTDQKDKGYLTKMDLVANEIYNLAIGLGGTLSGEHGDGLLRTPFLSRLYGEEVYSLFKKVKEIFDPAGIMNPGKIVGDQNKSIVHDLRYGEKYSRVDTGTTLNNERIAHEIEKCHGCGVCLSYCPTALVTFDERATPRAKGNLLRGVLSGNLSADLLQDREFKDVLDYCFNCKLCLTECPTQIDIPGIVIEAKSIFIEKTEKTRQDRFINKLPILTAAASVSPRLSTLTSAIPMVRMVLEKFTGIDRRRNMPRFQKPLYKRARLNKTTPDTQRKAIYFSGCFANYNDVSGEGLAAIEVLRRNRVDVRTLDSLRCCGIAKITTGSRKEAIPDASWNVEQLYRYVERGFDIVFSAPSCALAVKEDYPSLIGNESAKSVSEHVYELSDYLVQLYDSGALNTDFGPVERRVTYHNPCHSIPLGVRSQPVDLMRMIPDLDVVELSEDTCCGMAGTFGLKKQFYDLSMKSGSNLFSQIDSAKVDSVVTTCGTCNMQIGQATGLRVEHLAGILFESYLNFRRNRPSSTISRLHDTTSYEDTSASSDMVIE